MYLPKKTLDWYRIWRFRYRMYALIIALILIPILFSSGLNVNPVIDFPSDKYSIIGNFIIASRVQHHITNTSVNSTNLQDTTVDANKINASLKKSEYYTGDISNRLSVDISSSSDASQVPDKKPVDTSLDSIIKKPANAEYKSFLRYPKYNINTPIIYSTFDDLFQKKDDGSIDFTKPKDNDPTGSPIQKKLQDGIVHLAFTPQPGEIGNSYIIGHSSNYSFIKSNYNSIFKPLESKCAEGTEFIIYDKYGRELKFKVFECIKISDDDVAQAYKNFPYRRVVTLQTSILGVRNGKVQATHRWLVRGELQF